MGQMFDTLFQEIPDYSSPLGFKLVERQPVAVSCTICGTETHFLSLEFGVPVCSETCLLKIEKDFNEFAENSL